jgi:hypothetical protein
VAEEDFARAMLLAGARGGHQMRGRLESQRGAATTGSRTTYF